LKDWAVELTFKPKIPPHAFKLELDAKRSHKRS
jgi:hypothetical protein